MELVGCLVGCLVGGTGDPPVFLKQKLCHCHTFQTAELKGRPAGRRSHYMMKSDGIGWLFGWLFGWWNRRPAGLLQTKIVTP
jgi:hypothetical protein